MTLREIITTLELTVYSGSELLDRPVTGGYSGDLLSDVIAHADAGFLWVTIQRHRNIIAVATLKELAAVIIVQGKQPEPDVIEKANEEHIPVLGSRKTTFEVAGQLYTLGVHGRT